ncbi:uncharacterized protein E5676_scaffold163G00630 [Cucumis melo var. makuwa]|uniref:Ubiquitin-like protease family profile domain-containing protein n=1 Tax=Cucumis melo var. makuwa TaxID=1194695 RepID=A0A5D3C382_CUCMM|nr:uncharacterized protein E5676_scaffold163G00630 [Cucumis melo var. makuwa]
MENSVDEKYEHGDLFNTVNMFQSAHDESCNRSNTFDTMFDDAKKPLYPRCKKFTKLSVLVRLYDLKDELVATQKTTNAFGEEDILTRALGGKDRPRILCGVGKNHWTLVVINLTKGAAFWIDPLKNRIDPDVTELVERSSHLYVYLQCPKQSEVLECGYYVMWFMCDIILSRSTSIIQIIKDSPRAYTQDDIDCIRSEWTEFVGKHRHYA